MRENMGMQGRADDGGANALEACVRAFDNGVAKRIPEEWRRIAAPRMDPEFQEYLRLQAKFGR